MDLKPIDPYDDPRVTHEFAVLNGRRYRESTLHLDKGFAADFFQRLRPGISEPKPEGNYLCCM